MRNAIIILRVVLGLIFISHGVARLYYGSVNDFGDFLASEGIPMGQAVAWMITLGEIISGILLVLGYYVKYCCVFHAIIILGGILLVHLSQGWFVVGHGAGGVEYSLLILGVLGVLFMQDYETGGKV